MQDTQAHPETTFSLRDVTFRVSGRTLLAPLSMTFPAGKVTGLIGHNGSGKSTLLKMLGRHQKASGKAVFSSMISSIAGTAKSLLVRLPICRSSYRLPKA